MNPYLVHFFTEYGLLVLYLWLLIGVFIVPVPEEVVMLTVGILISRGDFSLWAYFVACIGSLSGVTMSYFLGRYLGRLLVVKYGKWFGLSEKRLAQGEALFNKHGKWSLPIGYFVLGTRHAMALIAGTTHYGWHRFALFAYPAGAAWVVLLVTLGYLAGGYWLKMFHLAAHYFYYFIVAFLALAAIGFFIYWYIRHKRRKQK